MSNYANITLESVHDKFIEYLDGCSHSISNIIEVEFHRHRYIASAYQLLRWNCLRGRIYECGGESLFSNFLKDCFEVKTISINGDIRHGLPFGKCSIDNIICMEILEHISDLHLFDTLKFQGIYGVVRNFYDILVPEGRLFVTTPNACSLINVYLITRRIPPMVSTCHIRQYSVEELVFLFQACGFNVLSINTEFVWDHENVAENMRTKLSSVGLALNNPGDDIFLVCEKPTVDNGLRHINFDVCKILAEHEYLRKDVYELSQTHIL